MLKNIFIITTVSFILPRICFAADGSIGVTVLYMVLGMVGIGIVGIVSGLAATAFGDGRIGTVIKNGSYLGCVAVFVAIATMVMDGVVNMIYKVIKLVS